MIISIVILAALVAASITGTAKLGAHINRADDERRENKRALSTQRARERAAILADDRAARLARDGARAARIARGGVAI